MVGSPKAMIVAFSSRDFNIYALSDAMSKRVCMVLHCSTYWQVCHSLLHAIAEQAGMYGTALQYVLAGMP